MSRQSKGARLFLRERENRQAVWVIRDGTKMISTGCLPDDLAGAERKLAEYIVKRPAKIEKDEARDPAKVKCAAVLDYYLKHHGPKTAAPELLAIHAAHLEPYWGNLTVDKIMGRSCREYIGRRTRMTYQGRPISSTTASKELGTLQSAVNFWDREFGLMSRPRVTKETKPARRERVLERSEFAKALWQARRLRYPHILRFLMIGRYTGTRADALVRLRWLASLTDGHVDTGRGILYRKGSGERETKKRRPPCELHPKLLWFCRKWQARDQAKGLTHVIHTGGSPLKEMRGQWKGLEAVTPWSKVIEAAGLAVDIKGKRSSDVTPHVLRHTCVSWGLWEGKSSFDMAGIVGASPYVIETVYGHHRLAAAEYRRKKEQQVVERSERALRRATA